MAQHLIEPTLSLGFFFFFNITCNKKTHHPNLPPPLWAASSPIATCSPPPTWTTPSPATVQAIGAVSSHGQVKPLPHAVHPGTRHHQQEQLLFSPARIRWLGATTSTTITNGTGCIHRSAAPIPHSRFYASSTNFSRFFYWPRPFSGSLQWRLSGASHLSEMAPKRTLNDAWSASLERLKMAP